MSQEVAGFIRRGLAHADADRAGINELLSESRRLIERAMDEYRTDRSGSDDIIHLRPGAGWEKELQQLLSRARQEAMLVVSSPLRVQPNYHASRTLVTDLLTTGRQVRLLYSRQYVETRDPASLLQHHRIHERTRVVDADLYNMIIVDKRIATIWGRTGEQRPHGLVIRDTGVLRVLDPLARILWESASDLSVHRDGPIGQFDDTSLAVLQALNEGLKDEVAARRLQVSLRTYRRYVADMMVRLGATTRFQIGARAAELGLLPPTW
ncbi:hypothetical protein ACQP1G_25050 [Nocardia sp. CA-107356]|uniref:hypothetical protein n=1 Tax=Nocardia sp. CA-107356 TaxID=3239972 RepID=UPI003D902D20